MSDILQISVQHNRMVRKHVCMGYVLSKFRSMSMDHCRGAGMEWDLR